MRKSFEKIQVLQLALVWLQVRDAIYQKTWCRIHATAITGQGQWDILAKKAEEARPLRQSSAEGFWN